MVLYHLYVILCLKLRCPDMSVMAMSLLGAYERDVERDPPTIKVNSLLGCSHMIGGKTALCWLFHFLKEESGAVPALARRGAQTCCRVLGSNLKLFQLRPQTPVTFPKCNQWDVCGVARSDTHKEGRQRVMEEKNRLFLELYNVKNVPRSRQEI